MSYTATVCAVGRDTGPETDAEAIDPIGSTQERGEVSEVQPDAERRAGDLGGIGPRLVDGRNHREADERIGRGTQSHRVAHAEVERLGSGALYGDVHHLGRGRTGREAECHHGQVPYSHLGRYSPRRGGMHARWKEMLPLALRLVRRGLMGILSGAKGRTYGMPPSLRSG
jgi:hypothetical protein